MEVALREATVLWSRKELTSNKTSFALVQQTREHTEVGAKEERGVPLAGYRRRGDSGRMKSSGLRCGRVAAENGLMSPFLLSRCRRRLPAPDAGYLLHTSQGSVLEAALLDVC